MTCIAAIVDKNGVGHIACDSLGSNGYTKSIFTNKKIFEKGDMLVGYTSSYRMGQILQYRLTMPERKVKQDLENYLYIDFLDSVRSALRDHGYMKTDSGREAVGTFIIVTEGRIFTLQDDMSLLESKDKFESCGSGEDYARATMNAVISHGVTDPKKILTEAIEAATKYTTGVGGDIHHLKEKAK